VARATAIVKFRYVVQHAGEVKTKTLDMSVDADDLIVAVPRDERQAVTSRFRGAGSVASFVGEDIREDSGNLVCNLYSITTNHGAPSSRYSGS
jgi:hypothetical protein